ncbi:phosphatase PAP2 family protein [Streptomyces sp. SID7909]|uniref:phosphatase PAP2 family protein n=1 Tax=Streptomyces sp. SID7909 TaxID=2706092 RepID=UPI0013B8B7B8|nr:phosphatase PAP2 family protein [Streptomyces sp. SID7909]NEC10640.1 phosphatase PAP2 family protein [Streptomyces sp. SID7909]
MHGITTTAASGYDGSGIDGKLYTTVVRTADGAPTWLDSAVSALSTYGLALFAVLMLIGWWQARTRDAGQAVKALAAPLVTLVAFAVSTVVKQAVHENRPCQSLHIITLEACPGPGDWSFPSNHATLAAAAAVALWFVAARLGVLATVIALAMTASRVWVGAHYPHDVLAGLALGALVALPLALLMARYAPTLVPLFHRTRMRPLIES